MSETEANPEIVDSVEKGYLISEESPEIYSTEGRSSNVFSTDTTEKEQSNKSEWQRFSMSTDLPTEQNAPDDRKGSETSLSGLTGNTAKHDGALLDKNEECALDYEELLETVVDDVSIEEIGQSQEYQLEIRDLTRKSDKSRSSEETTKQNILDHRSANNSHEIFASGSCTPGVGQSTDVDLELMEQLHTEDATSLDDEYDKFFDVETKHHPSKHSQKDSEEVNSKKQNLEVETNDILFELYHSSTESSEENEKCFSENEIDKRNEDHKSVHDQKESTDKISKCEDPDCELSTNLSKEQNTEHKLTRNSLVDENGCDSYLAPKAAKKRPLEEESRDQEAAEEKSKQDLQSLKEYDIEENRTDEHVSLEHSSSRKKPREENRTDEHVSLEHSSSRKKPRQDLVSSEQKNSKHEAGECQPQDDSSQQEKVDSKLKTSKQDVESQTEIELYNKGTDESHRPHTEVPLTTTRDGVSSKIDTSHFVLRIAGWSAVIFVGVVMLLIRNVTSFWGFVRRRSNFKRF